MMLDHNQSSEGSLRVLRGYIDSVTTQGYLEGWAFDTERPARPVAVSVFWDDMEIAWGLAHRFRADLMAAVYGVGWCAFRLRLAVLISDVERAPLRLLERDTGIEIHRRTGLSVIEDTEPPWSTVAENLKADPTVIQGTWQLKQCEELFMEFISRHGIEGFLGAAYAYMLGRPLDAAGLDLYTRLIRQGTLLPGGVLTALEESEEFRSKPRALAAPSAHNFPFTAP
jgi:hypothetical protein